VWTANPERTVIEPIDPQTDRVAGPPLSLASPIRLSVCSPRKDQILVACEDGSAFLWSPVEGKREGVVMRHPRTVTGAACSPDGMILATASAQIIRLWDATFCRPIGSPIEHGATIKGLRFSADGRWLLVYDQQGACRWPVPAPMEGDPARVLERVTKLTSSPIRPPAAKDQGPDQGKTKGN
jgi:WD40 repeat protein